MRDFDLKGVVEAVGAGAIVASLIFVGLQMRQAQNIAIAEQYQNRGISFRESTFATIENESLLRVFVERLESQYKSGNLEDELVNWYEAFGAESLAALYMVHRSNLVILDSFYLANQLGTMTDESWNAYQKRLKRSLHDPLLRIVYFDERDYLPESFRNLCDELIAEIESETDTSD